MGHTTSCPLAPQGLLHHSLGQPKAPCLHYPGCRTAFGEQMGSPGCQHCPLDAHPLAAPLPKVRLCLRSHPAVVGSHFLPRCWGLWGGLQGGLPFPSPAIATGWGIWVEVQRGLTPVPAFQGRVHGTLVSDAQELLGSFPIIRGVFFGQVAVSSLHVRAHALEELLDADLGKASGVLGAGLVEQLALDVDVVGPVPALQEGGLGEAGPEGSDQESQRGHQQHEAPAQGLQG